MCKKKWYKCPELCQWAEPKGWWERMGYRVWFPLLCFHAACFHTDHHLKVLHVHKDIKIVFSPVNQEVRMPLSRTHLWNEANQNERLQESHLQVDHEFNESLAVMHFVHGYGLCRSRRRNHRSQCSTILSIKCKLSWHLSVSQNQSASSVDGIKDDCAQEWLQHKLQTQIMYFCHNWQALFKKTVLCKVSHKDKHKIRERYDCAGYIITGKDMRAANTCGQLGSPTLSGTKRYCKASTAACWDLSPH